MLGYSTSAGRGSRRQRDNFRAMGDWEINVGDKGQTNFSWATKNGLLILYARDGEMSELRFGEFINVLRGDVTHSLSVSEGSPSITSVQRKALADTVKDRSIRMMVIVDSAFARGIITALGWLGLKIKSFGPNDLATVVSQIGIEGITEAEVFDLLETLRRETKGIS